MEPHDLLNLAINTAPWALAMVGFGAAYYYRHQVEKNKIIDHETGLYTKNGFNLFLADAINETSRPQNRALSLLYIDFDKMKSYNDRYGHVAVDELIHEISGTFSEQGRKNDIYAKMGGDEFAAILRQTDAHHAFFVAIRLQQVFSERFSPGFMLQSGTQINEGLSFTVGVAEYQEGMDVRSFKQAVDDQLMGAKKQDIRNCIVINNRIFTPQGRLIKAL